MTVVLDDDPTGTQAMADVPVVLDWSGSIRDVPLERDSSIHVLTNSRALDPDDARRIVADAAAAAVAAWPGCRLVLRGDSTLRAHVAEEYEAVAPFVAERVAMLLVPALPAAGRHTIDGIQLLERDGRRVPLHETEYARDGAFAYSTSHLAAWAEERSDGRFAARDAEHVPLAELRSERGPEAVAEAIARGGRSGRAAVVVPDVDSDDDLRLVARGLAIAEARELPVLVRSGPAFVAILTGREAVEPVPVPRPGTPLLVICGSYVSGTSVQLEQLAARRAGITTIVDIQRLAASDSREAERVEDRAGSVLRRHGVSVIATQREVLSELSSADALAVANCLAGVVRRVEPRPAVIVSKGGVTSAVVALHGLSATRARVIGPILSGVSLWDVASDRGPAPLVVVPGNVGGPDLLVDLLDRLVGPE